MTHDSGDNGSKKYSHTVQLIHKRLLDSFKYEFFEKFSNEEPRDSPKKVSDYDRIKTIGKGAFASVLLVRDKDSLNVHAMKAIEKAHVVKKMAVKHLFNEKKILLCVNFPFVLTCDLICKDNVYVYFILPFIPGGELYALIKKLGVLPENMAQFYAAQVVLGLEYLHHCCIIHRDIKPENIFIDRDGYIKIGDYGFAKVIKTRTWTLCGTPQYLAPEIIMSKGYTYSVDWWALGVLIFEMVSGYAPFCHAEPVKLYDKILAGRFKAPDTMSGICKQLVKRLLNVEPNKRFGSLKSGVYDIKSHAWFDEIDWNLVYHQKCEAPHIPHVKDLGEGEGFTDQSDFMLRTSPECEYEEEFKNF